MRLTQLRDFLAVAEHRSLRAAARSLSVAQPSLTKSIQALEKELGASLFQRTARGAIPTAAGVAFQARTQLIMEELRRAQEEIHQLNEGDSGEVSFAISAAPTFLFLSRTLQDFQKRYPEVKLRIINGIFPVTVPELRNGRLDFALVPRPNNDIGEEFTVETLLRNERVPVCRKSHPLVEARSLAELTSATWLATSIDPDPKAAFDDIFRSRGLAPPRHVIYCEMAMALVESLIHLDTISWLPRAWLEAEIFKPWLTAIPIEEPPVEGQDICLVQRRNFPLTPAADYLATLIRRNCAYRNGQL
jgi:LysR family transcriptional regulator, regulator of abg operon